MAADNGFLSPEAAEQLRAQLKRTQADLDALRNTNQQWREEVDRAIAAFNGAEIDKAKEAFARIDALIDARRQDRADEQLQEDLAQSKSKHAQATLFYPYDVSMALPLLRTAAELGKRFWYWIDYGDMLVAAGDLAQAEQAYGAAESAGSEISEYDVSVALERVGNVRVDQGDLPGALRVYEESLQIRRDLAARDPGNAGWARDVSVALNKVGDVRRAQGDLPGALRVYDESLQIARDLAARDPGNAGWARDVSISLDRVGDVRVAQGDLPGALTVYEESLQIRRALAARDPGNAGWARDVWVSVWRIAGLDSENAAQHWAEVVTRMEDMQARGILLAADEPFLAQARENLAAAQ